MKHTASGVERDLKSSIGRFRERALTVKENYRTKRLEILNDDMRSDVAKQTDLAKLADETGATLKDLRSEQDSYVKGVRDRVERALLGSQPTDANSVLLRRDAADRARRISDEDEAMSMLRDAARGGDDSLAHAVGYRARSSGWVDVLDAYRETHPDSADTAAALAVVEGLQSDSGYNLASGITYANPAA